MEKDDEEEEPTMNRSFSFAFKGGKSKSKKYKKRIDELEDDIRELKRQISKQEEMMNEGKKREK